jgi:hypothetical protein
MNGALSHMLHGAHRDIRAFTFHRVHSALVLRPSYVPEKVGVNKKRVNKKWYFHKK